MAIFDIKLLKISRENKENKQIIILTEIAIAIKADIILTNNQVRFDESSRSMLKTFDKVMLISEMFLIA